MGMRSGGVGGGVRLADATEGDGGTLFPAGGEKAICFVSNPDKFGSPFTTAASTPGLNRTGPQATQSMQY
jgi:hypothetical protein